MKDGFIGTKSGKVHYVEAGEGVPVLYVHGNTGSCRWFEKVMGIPGARTVSIDLPNFGRSDPIGSATEIDLYGDAIGDFVEAMRLDRPVLVGHSLGGAASISIAVRRPGLFRGLVLVDSAAPSGLVTPAERLPILAAMRTDRKLLSLALRGVMPANSDEAFFEALVDDAMLMAEPCWTGHAEALGKFDYRGRCQAFKAPVLVFWGRKDLLVNEAMARETAAAFPGSDLEIVEGVGHSVIVEDPGLFSARLAGFVAKL
jgi:branched-chain amino acid transport system permease protein